MPMDVAAELAAEQAHVDHAYERLAVRRGVATQASSDGRAETTPIRLRLERDELQLARARREDALRLGDLPLCFGRIDMDDDESWHIGRIAIDDVSREPLVVDWRAPIAEPFYRATSAATQRVTRRRHLRCRGATVLELDDEILERTAATDALPVVGEAALLRAVARRRTGRMADIVATIQREQDEIIRAPLDQTLVVQGGPGTGKTAVALHRIAYLVYTHRELLEAKGVLLVGPSATFLRYIESVLPSLGEQGARFRTAATLVEGVPVTRADGPEAMQIKGDARMATVLERAVASRQRPLRKAVAVAFGAHELRMSVEASRRIVDAARERPGRHNERRALVERLVLRHLHRVHVSRVERAQRAGRSTATPLELDQFSASAGETRAVRVLLDRLWPLLSPEQLVGDLLGRPALLREAAEGILSDDEQAAIARTQTDTDDDGWSEADLALLDEVAAPLGPMPPKGRVAKPSEDRDFMADRVLAGLAQDASLSFNANMAAEIRDRIRDDQVQRVEGTPERGRVGKSFGHVVVDEAQDLSPMQWRMIARRCPSGSMTLVGDVGQASGLWRRDWDTVLAEVAPRTAHRTVELTVNYRTPSEVMDLAATVLAAAAPGLQPPTSIRAGGEVPAFVPAPAGAGLAAAVAVAAAEARAAIDTGTAAVIAPAPLHGAIRAALDHASSTRSSGGDPLDDPVALLTPERSKGLEFDAIVVVEPSDIVGGTTAGLLALYIALTRTTGRLTIVHSGALPASLT
jgi:DNA helicase IV